MRTYVSVYSFSQYKDLQAEDELLCDSKKGGGAGKDEDCQPEEDVGWHEPGPEMRGQAGEQEGHQTTNPLKKGQQLMKKVREKAFEVSFPTCIAKRMTVPRPIQEWSE